MHKVLLVINAQRPDADVVDFACKIAVSANAKLTALLVEDISFYYLAPIGMESPAYYAAITAKADAAATAGKEQVMQLFQEQCRVRGVNSSLIVDEGDALQKVIFESRFADMVIIDPQTTIVEGEEQLPSQFVKEVLASAECPVLLAPDKFVDVQEIDFCYDGSPSAAFAIKQFTYLMPQYRSKKIRVVEVGEDPKEEYNEADRRMMEWLRANYPSVCYQALKGNAKDELFSYFFMARNKMIVMGAYGRSLISNFFRKSSADILIRTVNLPLFIAHH